MKIGVQINGKLRDQFECSASATQEEVIAQALAAPEVKKQIYVPKNW